MSDGTFVYVIHIATTPEKLWEALTSNAFWQQYWGGEWQIESEWKTGSPVKFFTSDGKPYSQGEVLESNAPTTLSYTWPEPEGEKRAEFPERLVWQISSSGPGTVMLKLIHDRLSEDYF